ncbi:MULTISPECIES: helix-turn-helix domain-containing protein [Bartonella]|uniref:HTH-type transcriptional regulator / antitoxin HigA n=3 Tax=Bartonella TaxID=773 RepID=E6Z102_BARSR|nr:MULTISPECIES: transcriptional regulator [Bartonella]AQX31184.1 HTH-type transcriptional regulator / antitoxin HigA [Bartonella schoenbuchensis R1]MBA9083080.1 HTH-type transcriptional regulator/antitoxin HigA [Bartonella chomelii]CBI82790.1 putative HTH-type transcriptional regulator ygjM [Bartonella schoenbuchensis R1]CDP80315.1 Antitoxin HigA [Bartonella schoenbuchensis]CDP80327.1 Antitoxin HigA [Bartonella schoenbuchensis]
MNIKPIRTEEDYQKALEIVSTMFDNQPEMNTSEFDKMEILVLLIEAYETEHFSVSPPHPIEAIKFRMEQMNLSAKDLVPAIGHLNRVYEILNGKRKLTLRMIKNLHQQFNIPLESLIA